MSEGVRLEEMTHEELARTIVELRAECDHLREIIGLRPAQSMTTFMAIADFLDGIEPDSRLDSGGQAELLLRVLRRNGYSVVSVHDDSCAVRRFGIHKNCTCRFRCDDANGDAE